MIILKEKYFYFIWIIILGIGILSAESFKGEFENQSQEIWVLYVFPFYSPSIVFASQASPGFPLNAVLAIC